MSVIADVLIDASDVDKPDFRSYLAAREIASAKDDADSTPAVGDGVAADQVAITAKLAAHTSLWLAPGTYLITGLESQVCKFLYGAGELSVLKTVTNAPVLTISGNDVTVQGIKCLGDGKGATADTGKTSQHGISMTSCWRTKLINVSGENLGGALLYGTTAVDVFEGNQAIGCVAKSCNIGVHADVQFEYFHVANFMAQACHYGHVIAGGNFIGVGGDLSGCGIAFDLRAGTNNAHGVCTGYQLNHSTTYGIKGTNTTLGFTFNGCTLYEGSILLTNTVGVHFINGQLEADAYYFDGSVGTRITDNLMPGNLANTVNNNYNAHPSHTQWARNHKVNGKAYPSGALFGIDGGYAKATAASDLAAVATAGSGTIIFPTLSKNYGSGDNAHTLYTFYATGTGKFTAKGLGRDFVKVRASFSVDIAGASPWLTNIALRVNGTWRAYLPAMKVTATVYIFAYSGEIEAVDGDEITFFLTNNSGGNATVLGGTETFMECEGL